jgi:hypothetical protein
VFFFTWLLVHTLECFFSLGYVDFCSFKKVFSRALGVRHVGIVGGTTSHFWFGENPLGMKLGLHGFGDGVCGFMLGLHTHKKV